jgi:hypothetical protein
MVIPRESWIVLALAGGSLALVQTLRLMFSSTETRRRLVAQAARALQGEVLAERLLARAGYRVEARQVKQSWCVFLDGKQQEVGLRADLVVARGGRRFVAEVKTGEEAPDITTPSTRRQLLEYRAAFAVDGVLLVDAEAQQVYEVAFPKMAATPIGKVLVSAFIAGVMIGAALVAALLR